MNSSIQNVVKYIGGLLLIIISLHSSSQVRSLKAMNDTIDLIPGIPLVYNILANDTIPANDTIQVVTFQIISGGSHVIIQKAHNSTWVWVFTFTVPYWGYNGENLVLYRLWTKSADTTSAKILFRIRDKSYCYLDTNNVSARLNSSGLHFCTGNAGNAGFEVSQISLH